MRSENVTDIVNGAKARLRLEESLRFGLHECEAFLAVPVHGDGAEAPQVLLGSLLLSAPGPMDMLLSSLIIDPLYMSAESIVDALDAAQMILCLAETLRLGLHGCEAVPAVLTLGGGADAVVEVEHMYA